MLAPSLLPTLTWTPPTEITPDTPKKGQSIGSKILSDIQAVARGSARIAPLTTAGEPAATTPQNTKFDENALWREKARACEESKDFLAAAVCYNFLNDVSNSARCYRQAAAQLKMKEGKGE
jgi:hypothetical protein